jgi:hypothetical protein
MLKSYSLLWLTIAIGGSLINTFIWWLDEMILNTPNSGFNHGPDYYFFVFVMSFILSSLSSFPSILIIYLIEGWKKHPFTIWLHLAIFAIHLVGIFLFSGLDEDALFGFIGYEFIGIVAYYFWVYKQFYLVKSNNELIDRD